MTWMRGCLVLMLLCAVISWAQPPEPPPAPPVLGVGNGPMAGPPMGAPPPGAMEMPAGMMGGVPLNFEQMKDMLVANGMDEKDATFMALLASGGDSSWLLPYMMMSERGGGGGGGMDDMMGMLVMKKMLAPQGTAGLGWISGKYIYIVENGILYKINTDTMQVEGHVAYRGGGVPMEAMAGMGPMFAEARAKAQQTACLSNLKQLGMGFLMYAQDWDEKLPGKDWVEATQPYLKNMQVLICPGRPGVKVGYVYNEAVMGAKLAKIGQPAETVLVFEGEPAEGKDFGGPERIAEGGYHNGGVEMVFVDGHAKWMPVAEAKEMLAAPKP